MKYKRLISLVVVTTLTACSSGNGDGTNTAELDLHTSSQSSADDNTSSPNPEVTQGKTSTAAEDQKSQAMPKGAADDINTTLPKAPSTPAFVARLAAPVALINITSPGTLSIRGNCLIVTVSGQDYTATFNGPASTTDGTVRYEGGSLPLDRETDIPGGRLDPSEFSLIAPAPSACPTKFFGIGG